jgi:hypothetical protein
LPTELIASSRGAIGKDKSGPLRFCNKFIAGNAQSFFNAKLKALPP